MSRPLRLWLVTLAALAVAFVAWPARAAAPICDSRGASALAPAPTLDAPNASIDVGRGPEACLDILDRDDSLHQGRASKQLPSPAGADLLPGPGQGRIPRCGVASSSRERGGGGFKSVDRERLERPPRFPRPSRRR